MGILQWAILAGAVGSIVMMMKERKTAVTPDMRPLEGNTRIVVWVTSLLSPIWSGLVYHFGWRSCLPTMAKQANRISYIAIIPWILGFIVLILLPAMQAA